MGKTLKFTTPAAAFLLFAFIGAEAGENTEFDFNRGGAVYDAISGSAVPAPSAPEFASAGGNEGRTLQPPAEMLEYESGLVNSLTPAQWEESLAAGEELSSEESKGLFSDFNTRYVSRGVVTFKTNPPTFTTDTGKVFVVRKYPAWLKKLGDADIAVEGYAKQQDDTSELVITKMLPPSGVEDSIKASQEAAGMQKHPYIISKEAGKYVVGNVRWAVAHASDGTRVKDKYGNLVPVWRSGVVVNPELFEAAYVVKKISSGFPRQGTHGLLMFKFKPGGVVDAKGNAARGLAVSLNIHFKNPDMSYSQADAMLKGKHMVYYSVSTIEGYVEYNMFWDYNPLLAYPLTISRGQQLALLEKAIGQATDDKTGEMYSLFYNSCTNAVVSLVNGVLTGDQKIRDGWLPEFVYRLRASVPDTATTLLRKKGVIGAPNAAIDENNYVSVFAD